MKLSWLKLVICVAFIDLYALIAYVTFISLVIGKTFMTKKYTKTVIALGKYKRGRAKTLELSFYLGIVFLAYLIMVGALDTRFFGILELYVLFKHPLTDWLGFILLNGSIIMFAFAIAAMKDAWRIGVDYKKTDTLITNGIFAISRNPIYVAIILLLLGYFLIYANFFFLGALLFMGIAFMHQIQREEAWLSTIFGTAYEDYKNTTRRIVGKKQCMHTNKSGPLFVSSMKGRKKGGEHDG